MGYIVLGVLEEAEPVPADVEGLEGSEEARREGALAEQRREDPDRASS